jgi:glycosyltransferase involved in cell wall biosynthesis
VPKLSVTVLTRNEADNIAAALESVAWADEIVVVDAESTDETVAIARRYTERVVVRAWPGFPQQKNYAASIATHDWILSLDADERVTPALGTEIRRLLAHDPAAAGYRVRRVTLAFGRWIRSTDWYPDWQLRLYDRRHGRWDESRRVHESVRVDREPARLEGELEHLAYRDLSHHLATIDRYTSLAAEDMAAHGRRATALDILVHPPLAFVRNYLLRGGIRDGRAGLIISSMNAWYVFMKYAKLWELGNRR